ncbi:MAG: glutathione S-transferase family protein [Alphaproteobacteria bacterium]|nr:glutathione S-transferase family protein [Alphaproteobacteria bacterium]MDX5370756.1 glutathione S-transferase family protein [Alphaproteobacteria bacterium]MDX5465170.1 glutathione S-transferase family protein [Alphaproteobacteria bacterium]
MTGRLTLYIGTKAWSSWSMRPWLALKLANAEFEEVLIPLREHGTTPALQKLHGAAKVPVLHHEVNGQNLTVWDSLAICEYANELFPDAGLWPEDREARAHARAAAAEMHSGFAPLRKNCPMDMGHEHPGRGLDAEGVAADIARIEALWAEARSAYGAGGRFLYGRPTIADCMYAPVVSRFRTYQPELSETSLDYVAAVSDWILYRTWEEAAVKGV